MRDSKNVQGSRLQVVAAKRDNPARLPVTRDTILREVEAAGGRLEKLGDGHKFSRRDISALCWYAVAHFINRNIARVDGYGRPLRIGPQSARCSECGGALGGKEAA